MNLHNQCSKEARECRNAYDQRQRVAFHDGGELVKDYCRMLVAETRSKGAVSDTLEHWWQAAVSAQEVNEKYSATWREYRKWYDVPEAFNLRPDLQDLVA